jgi:hypothetical protein
VPAALLNPVPPGWRGTIRTTGDFVARGDQDEAALRVCRAQVDGIRKWNDTLGRPDGQ